MAAKSSLNDTIISKAIIDSFSRKLTENLRTEVAIVGGGPAGLVAGYYLARNGIKTVLFERKLSIGGGMWGGGIMFNEIVVQEAGKKILDEFKVPSKKYKKNYYTADSIQTVSTLCSKASLAGLTIFNLMEVEDLLIRNGKINGLVINWSSVSMAKLHVDPISVESRYIIDATGHPCEISRMLEEKAKIQLNTETGRIMGEKSMWAERGESLMDSNTREIFPGIYVSGMASNAVFGGPRMGPIFGGMLISGKKVAEKIIKRT